MNSNYPAAIKWGSEGAELKRDSHVDTLYSSEHILALAERDSGAVDAALKHFLGGADIEEVIDPKTLDVDRGGNFYGNIGRCLHLMGQIEPALICYKKSADLIEHEEDDNTWENQAYIRQWIGELLLSRGDTQAALSLLVASQDKWATISPPRARRLQDFITESFAGERPSWPSSATAEKFALRWISNTRPPRPACPDSGALSPPEYPWRAKVGGGERGAGTFSQLGCLARFVTFYDYG